MTTDGENLESTMKLLTDDCVWVLEPGVVEYHCTKQLRSPSVWLGILMPTTLKYEHWRAIRRATKAR